MQVPAESAASPLDEETPVATVEARDRDGMRSGRFAGGVLLLVLLAMWLGGWYSGTDAQQMFALTIWGVMLGGIIALGGIGLTLCYGVLKFPNFAHGELVTMGAYVTFAVIQLVPQSDPIWRFSFGWDLLGGLLCALVVTGVVAIVVDRLLYRRLRRHQSPLVLFAMASLGMAFFLRSVIYLLWGSDFHFFYVGRANPAMDLPFGLRLQADQLFVFALALVLVVLLYWLLNHTRIGKAMRATAGAWGIGGALAAAGGVMYALASQLRPDMGFTLLLPMFAGVIMGGIGNAWGALIGSIIIGVAIQLTSAFMSPAYGPAVAFMLMVLTLLMRPQGLFTQR